MRAIHFAPTRIPAASRSIEKASSGRISPLKAKGGDAVSLFAYLHSMSQGDAARRLVEEFGLGGYHANGGPNGEPAGFKPSLTIEQLARVKGLPLDFLKKHGVEQSGRFVKFTYYGADGRPAPRYRLRQKLTGKNKTIWNPKDEGRSVPTEPRP